MARKTMTKEVTQTTVKISKIENENGEPKLVKMPDEVLIGNVNAQKAQKEMNEKHGAGVTVFEIIPNTEKYRMSVEDFINLAEKVEDEETQETQEQQ